MSGGEDLAKYPNLRKRGSVWYLHMRVPFDVVEQHGSEFIVKSLKETDRAKAITAYKKLLGDWTNYFEELRAKHEAKLPTVAALSAGHLDRLSDYQTENLVWHWYERRKGESPKTGFGDLDEVMDTLEEDRARLHDLRAREDMHGLVAKMLVEAGMPVHQPFKSIKLQAPHVRVTANNPQYQYLVTCSCVPGGSKTAEQSPRCAESGLRAATISSPTVPRWDRARES